MASGYHPNIPTILPTATFAPSGTAGGDLSGNYPAPNVARIQNRAVANTAPVGSQTLQWNSTTLRWEPSYGKIRTITTSQALTINDDKIIVSNGATPVTLTLPAAASCAGKCISISRGSPSTGTITINSAGGTVQALTGALGATTTIGTHSTAGGGLRHEFWSNGTSWFR